MVCVNVMHQARLICKEKMTYQCILQHNNPFKACRTCFASVSRLEDGQHALLKFCWHISQASCCVVQHLSTYVRFVPVVSSLYRIVFYEKSGHIITVTCKYQIVECGHCKQNNPVKKKISSKRDLVCNISHNIC